jgi:di/tricarboxylate transporter
MLKTSLRIVALAAIVVASGSALAGLMPGLWQPALLSLSIILLWATGALPEDQTALIFFVGASLQGFVRPEIIFSGFATTAFWLVFGGLVIGAAVRRCGLDIVIARPFLAFTRGAYWRAVVAVILISLVLSLVVPSSMTRVMLSVPVVLALCEQLGLGDGRGKLGLVAAAVLASYYFGSGLLPANVPNMALVGSTEKILPIHFRFAEYFITYFPVLGLVKTALAGCLIVLAFNVPVADVPVVKLSVERDDNRKWLVGLVLIAALLFWVTDFVHGISPAWIAMIAALIFLFPGVDIVPLDQFGRLVNVRPLFFVAGILGLGSFIAASGLGTAAAQYLSAWVGLKNDGSLREVGLLTGISATLGLLATHGGMAALMPSLAKDLAVASGLPIKTVIGTVVVGYSILLLPYQVPPSLVGFQIAAIPSRDAALATFAIGLVTSLVAVPLQFMWWRAIGFY